MHIRDREKTRTLPVKLSVQEVAVKSSQLAHKLGAVADQKAAVKLAASSAASILKNLEKDRDELAECVRSGKEHREVDVLVRPNLTLRTWEVVRCDSLEIVESDAMSDYEYQQERQEKLDLEPRPSGGARVETKPTKGASSDEAAPLVADPAPLTEDVLAKNRLRADASGKTSTRLSPKPLTATVEEHAIDDGKCVNALCGADTKGQARKGRCRPCADFLRRNNSERHVSKGATVKDSTIEASAE